MYIEIPTTHINTHKHTHTHIGIPRRCGCGYSECTHRSNDYRTLHNSVLLLLRHRTYSSVVRACALI